ncbi:MAG TPA: penicillin acylase family protein [Candidatus Aminicenantes bacterium]|nr:penicillin acylase family protein [Candidatus Aminicenantes bacterium]HRY66127.1 penicillin acylase family protein [Candidatus Aminicenantes bacterium]HRZ73041.1 penicillin acylase family protein [Candidatus Aminicenantes bacterium]
MNIKGTAVAALLIALSGGWSGQDVRSGPPARMPGLQAAAEIVRDSNGIAHIRAANEHDLFFLNGYVHAEDRLFQMDVFRHTAAGALAELVGPAALAQDVKFRTLGLGRAAARSWAAASPRVRAILEAYADGVNAFVAGHPLPPEYGALGVGAFDPWEPLDTMKIVKVLCLQQGVFNETDIPYTTALLNYQAAGGALGFDGTKLFYDDLFRSAPFETATTVPDAMAEPVRAPGRGRHRPAPSPDPSLLELMERHVKETDGIEFFRAAREGRGGGSNGWAVGGRWTDSGFPLMANDPHLEMPVPPYFYPIHLSAGRYDVTGQSFAGAPTVMIGHSRWFSWGFTNPYVDTIDYYSEQVVPDASSPSGLSSIYLGQAEHVIPVPETYRARIDGRLVVVPPGSGIPAASLIVPRRNNGPIVQLDQATGAAISWQWTGSGASQEFEGALAWAEARTVEEFARGTRLFTFPQNIVFIGRRGDFGYFLAGEIPIREDLQAGAVNGAPPWLLRNGRGGNEWLAVANPQPDQMLPYEIIPAEEMPHVVNPPAGFVVNANNDPTGITLGNEPLAAERPGGGIYYIGYSFNIGSRAARITEMLKQEIARGAVSFEDMKRIQADTVLMDARFFVPHIVAANANAARAGAAEPLALFRFDPALQEAVARLAAWDFTTPTGIPEGYDAGDEFGRLGSPSSAEIAASAAAAIYALWRSQAVASVFDAKLAPYGLPLPQPGTSLADLRHLLESFPARRGVGESGIDFFAYPGVPSPEDRRDIYLLRALRNALDMLAGDGFANAFGRSTNQSDYRWGKLNRVIFKHPLGSIFNIPPAGGTFPPPLPTLSGIPVDGGFNTVDPASNTVRAVDENSFLLVYGPVSRSVAEGRPSGIRGVSSLAGGVSGVLGSPYYWNLLPGWLTNTDYYYQYFGPNELAGHVASALRLVPEKDDLADPDERRGPGGRRPAGRQGS